MNMGETLMTTAAHPKVLIVGGGASGLTCALYLARAQVPCVVLDRGKPVLQRALLNNFPGLQSTKGMDWLAALRTQLYQYEGVHVENGKVAAINRTDWGFKALLETGKTHTGKFLVLASGQAGIDFSKPLGLSPIEGVQPYVKRNIETDRWGETRVPRVYACGVLAGWPSQTVICAGSGANVAIGIATRMRGEYWVDHDVID